MYPNPQFQQPFSAGPPMGPQGWGGASPFGGRPSRAMAYVSASLFLLCGAISILIATMCTQTSRLHSGGYDAPKILDFPDIAVSAIGFAFGNGAIDDDVLYTSMGFTIGFGSSVLLLSVAMFFRFGFARWILAGTGVLVSLYYLYAVIWIVANGGAKNMAFLVITLLVWLAATVVVMLPQVGQGMRGYQPRPAFAPPGFPPQQGFPASPGFPQQPPPGSWR